MKGTTQSKLFSLPYQISCSLGISRNDQKKVNERHTNVMVELAIPCVCLTKHIKLVHLPSLCLFFFFCSSTSSFHLQPDAFGHVRCKKKMQEGEEERKDSSKGIWLVLIWKYCFTSSELNYRSELAVLRE